MPIKRYSLVVPKALFDHVEEHAKEEHTSILDTLRQFIKLGLFFKGRPGAQIIIRDTTTGEEKEILFL